MGVIAFENGRILSMDPVVGEPEILVIDGGRIVGTGGRDILAAHPGAERVDLGGRTLIPGLIDAHNHLCIAALHPRWADVSDVADEAELETALEAQAAREPAADWIRAHGWRDAFPLTARTLDAFGLGRPVIVVSYTLHMCVVDTRGLEALSLGAASVDPPGGEIARGADGRPNGVLFERAASGVYDASLAGYDDPDRWGGLIEARATTLLTEGITAVHDAACPPEAETVYASLARDDRLPISVTMMPHRRALLGRLDAARLDGAPSGEGDHRLRVGAVKLFADGGVAPAIDATCRGAHIELGMQFPGLVADAAAVAERGFDVAVHAIGNAAVETSLEAFEVCKRVRDDVALRLEHVFLAMPDQISRMRALDVSAVVQPGFVEGVGAGLEQLPIDDADWFAFRDLAEAGIPIAASSDDPCAFWQPMRTSLSGLRRRTSSGVVLHADQSLPFARWLEAYTAGAARAGCQGGERGRLAAGLRADLVLVDGDIESADTGREPRVVETWIGGERLFAAGAADPG